MNQNDSLFRTDAFPDKGSAPNELLIISRKGPHTKQFEDGFAERMDPRDKIINVPFHFSIPAPKKSLPQEEEDFLSSELFSAVAGHIEDYLVRMLEAVVSVSFNELMEGKLKESECKDYASKNILLNVHAVCKETFRTLKERSLIEGREKEL